MFCLFRNSHIHPTLNRYVILVSLLSVIGWLYFSFVEKSLVSKVFEGQALIVDLVFGLPLVLMLAVVVYATVYWSCKLLIIFLAPQAIVANQSEEEASSQKAETEEVKALEKELGQEYWSETAKDDKTSPSSEVANSTTESTSTHPPK